MDWKARNNKPIDATRDMALIAQILEHVNTKTYIFTSDASKRDLTIFDGQGADKVFMVFMHYVMLIDRKFTGGDYDIQVGSISARFLTWEWHNLFDRLTARIE